MFIQPLDLTTALRPSLFPDEILLCVQDAVGLYEGNEKIPDFQRGHVYLTSLRLCYVDDEQPRKNSVSVSLRDVDRYEYYGGFLKSSPKITIYPKPFTLSNSPLYSPSAVYSQKGGSKDVSRSSNASPIPRSRSPFKTGSLPASPRPSTGTWICPVCSFSNPVPINFDPRNVNHSTIIQPCRACGIKPDAVLVLKAAIAAASRRQVVGPDVAGNNIPNNSDSAQSTPSSDPIGQSSNTQSSISCPRCTFLNYPSLPSCEMCGASLPSSRSRSQTLYLENLSISERATSPGPLRNGISLNDADVSDGIKVAFRGGGAREFYEQFKGSMIQRRWILQTAPPVPDQPTYPLPSLKGGAISKGTPTSGSSSALNDQRLMVGIAGLERRDFDKRKNNELVIGNAFEDLEALIASAKEIMALAKTFRHEVGDGLGEESSEASALLSESATALGMVTTKDVMGSSSDDLYLSELSRTLAEYLTDDVRGILRHEGGTMSLVDLWAVFNRSRNGVELVSPSDFEKAARLWEKLRLPVRLRAFKSGLLVVQPHDWSDENTIYQLRSWLRELHDMPAPEDSKWDWRAWGRGVTVQDAAQRFGWSVGVASEELEMAEDRGVLCREESAEGTCFWENFFVE